MKDLTLGTLLAVVEEIFGKDLFWAMLAAAIVITLACLFVLIRDHRVSWRKILWAQVAMPLALWQRSGSCWRSRRRASPIWTAP